MSNRSKPPKRRPGGQPGNQNARTHGFYSNAFDRADRETYEIALSLPPDDLTDEIAALRTRLKLLIEAEPENIDLLAKAIGQLARLAATHYHLSGTAADHLSDAMRNVLQDIEQTLTPKGE